MGARGHAALLGEDSPSGKFLVSFLSLNWYDKAYGPRRGISRPNALLDFAFKKADSSVKLLYFSTFLDENVNFNFFFQQHLKGFSAR